MNILKTNIRKTSFGILLCSAGLAALAASPSDREKLATANTGFAFDLLKQIVKEQPDTNVFISPFSVSGVLQMVGNGAAGETKTEMQRVLKTAGLPPGELNSACKDLNQSLNSQPGVVLNLANAIWYKEGLHLKPGFVSDNRNFFLAKLAGVDFAKPESAQTINDWADTSTRGKIKDVVKWPFDPLTRVILANAIYFKGKWKDPFDKSQTKPRMFRLPNGESKQAPMMWQHRHFGYQENDDFQAVRLGYASRHLEMIVFLPKTNSNPQNILTKLSTGSWQDDILSQFADREGTLVFPKFELKYEVQLKDLLKALGMKSAFAMDANFSAMADEPLFVSEVKQKSFVEVNEEGTVAAAVTGVHMTAIGVTRAPEKPFEMIVDRPFFFVIEDDKTQSILFMGVVYDPAGAGATE
jgi:serine protease inhibitor